MPAGVGMRKKKQKSREVTDYQHSQGAVQKFLFEKCESLIGLGAILGLAVFTDLIRLFFAIVIFALLAAVFFHDVKSRIAQIRSVRIRVAKGNLIFLHGDGEEETYPLLAFDKVQLKRDSAGAVRVFKLFGASKSVKVQHVDGLDSLYREVAPFIREKEQVRWWWLL